jgi:hypothetical protein
MGIFSRKSSTKSSTEGLILDRTWADQELDVAVAALEAGDLETPLEMLKAQTFDPDRRAIWVGGLGRAALGRSEQLRARLDSSPNDPELLVWLAQTLVAEAWEARTAKAAKYVSTQQFTAFHEILSMAHEVVKAAIAAAPDDPVPWTVYQWIAIGLGGSRDVHDQIFEAALTRQPDSHAAHSNRVQVIAPKWYGTSTDELLRFGEETAAKAGSGRVLGTVLAEAVIEAAFAVLRDTDMNLAKRVLASSRLADQWRAAVLEGREKWLQPDRCREPADLIAHNNYAYFLRNTHADIARSHAASLYGRVSSVPWCYRGEPVESFAKAFPRDKR